MKRVSYFLLILASITIITSCRKDDSIKPNKTNVGTIEDFNQKVKSLPELIQPELITEPVVIDTIDQNQPDGDYLCGIKRYQAAPGYSELLLLDPTSDVIYPGALIKGETILTGEYIPIVANRKPITISVSLQNIVGSPSRTVNDPKLSTIREAVNDILSSELTGSTPSKVAFEVLNVYSEEQLNSSLAANYSSATVDIGSSFNFSSDKNESRIVVKFLQSYYTIDMDPAQNPSDLFNTLPDINSLGSNSPLYVSTVTYGRMILFTATSSYSSAEMNAAFEAAFNSGVSNGSVDINAGYKKIVNESKIEAFVLGGSGADAVKTVTGIEGVKEFITNGGDYSKDSPAAPLSYKLRYLKDNSIANIVLATEYNVRSCEKVRYKYRITLSNIDCTGVNDAGDAAEMFGNIAFHNSSGTRYLWGPFDDNHYQIVNSVLTVNNSMVFSFTNPTPGSYITISGHLYEEDTGGDDDLGYSSKKIYLSDIMSGSAQLHFNGDGDAATANFKFTSLD